MGYLKTEVEELPHPCDKPFQDLGGGTIYFPVGKCGDITIFFQHYKTFNEAKSKWDERKTRINFDNIYLILVDTFCTKEIVEDFFNLDFKNKLFITGNKDLLINENCFLLDLEDKAWYEVNFYAFDFRKWFLRG